MNNKGEEELVLDTNSNLPYSADGINMLKSSVPVSSHLGQAILGQSHPCTSSTLDYNEINSEVNTSHTLYPANASSTGTVNFISGGANNYNAMATSLIFDNTKVLSVIKPDSLTWTSTFQDSFFSNKLSPMIGTQSVLLGEITELSGRAATNLITHTSEIGSFISPLNSATALINSSIEKMGTIVSSAGSLALKPTYDLTNQPLMSTLNFVSDAISLSQSLTATVLGEISNKSYVTAVGSIEHIGHLATLSGMALDTFTPSFTFPVAKTTDEEIKEVKKDVKRLEIEINNLRSKKKQSDLSEIRSKIVELLEKIDKDLKDKFIGAVNAVESENEDFIAQSSQSYTTILKKLPLSLGVQIEVDGDRRTQVKKGLSNYLKLDLDHYLVAQQPALLETLGALRHENNATYVDFKKDKTRYLAIVMQIETWIYSILTFENNE